MAARKTKSNAERDLGLILKAQDGDMQARDQLIKHYWPTMRYHVARRVFGGHIEDGTQDVAIRVLKSIPRYRTELGAVSTFLTRQIMHGVSDFLRELAPRSVQRPRGNAAKIAGLQVFQREASIDQLRSGGYGEATWSLLQDIPDDDCDYDWQVMEDEDAFDHLLRSLREPMRTIIDQRFRYDKTFLEIGKMVGCSESSASQMFSAERPILGARLQRLAEGASLPTVTR